MFILTSNSHEQNTRSAPHGLVTKPCCSTSKYDTNTFAALVIKSLNFFQRKFSDTNLRQLFHSQLKLLIEGAEANCVEIATEMKKCFKLKDILNFNVL